MKDMPDGWKTPEGELYNVQEVYEDTIVLAYGDNGKTKAPKKPQACIWVNNPWQGEDFCDNHWSPQFNYVYKRIFRYAGECGSLDYREIIRTIPLAQKFFYQNLPFYAQQIRF